ncbi:MAG: methyl-accepting chemotaxis protein [Desulfobacterales bacterium]|nr:methyl-accepting chemotaxis protein [Desulfobacterales bacterium]
MSQDYKRQWRNFIINRALQLRILLVSLAYMIVMLAITLGFTLLPVLREMFTTPDLAIQYRSAQTFLILAQRLVPSMVVLFLLFFIHLMITTHRICGPLVNFSRTFECMAEGDFTRPVVLRRKDHLQPEADMINEAQENISEQIIALKEANLTLGHAIAEAEKTSSPDNFQTVKERQAELKELLDAFYIT